MAGPTVVGKTVTIGWDTLHTGTTHCDSWKHLLSNITHPLTIETKQSIHYDH